MLDARALTLVFGMFAQEPEDFVFKKNNLSAVAISRTESCADKGKDTGYVHYEINKDELTGNARVVIVSHLEMSEVVNKQDARGCVERTEVVPHAAYHFRDERVLHYYRLRYGADVVSDIQREVLSLTPGR